MKEEFFQDGRRVVAPRFILQDLNGIADSRFMLQKEEFYASVWKLLCCVRE